MLMHFIYGILLSLLFTSIFAYFRYPRWLWASTNLIILFITSIFHFLPIMTLIVSWVIFIPAFIFAYISPVRMRLVTQPIMKFMSQSLPPMSKTEQEALNAGDIWWDGDILQGQLNWKAYRDFNLQTLTLEEKTFYEQQTQTLCAMLDDWKIMQDHDLTKEVWDYIKKEKFWALHIPKEYGGLAFSANAHSAIVAKIASRSVSAAVTVMVPNSLGPAELLMHYGTSEQKNYYLPRLARGEEIPCFALTSTLAGSDAASMPDKGIIAKGMHEGKEVIGIRLTWDKRYITLAPIATVLGLAFKLYDPDHLLGTQDEIGITVCLLPTNHPGVEIGKRHVPLMMSFMNGTTRGHDVFIPLDWIIGGAEMIGQGWRMLMECLAVGRGISLPSMSAASAALAYRTTSAYARIRKQFKLPIGEFEGVQYALARIAGLTYAVEACRDLTAQAISQGIKPAVISAVAKYHTTELSRVIINDAMDIHGGRGIQMGPHNYLANAYISTPIGITVEGANILTRNMIIFGQGAMRCHPFIQHEIHALAENDTIKFDKTLISHVGYIISTTVRACITSLSVGRLLCVPKWDGLERYLQQLSRVSQNLAFVSEMALLILGGKLKRRENLSARLGDVLSHIYLSIAVLKQYADHPNAEDKQHAIWALQYHLNCMQNALMDFLNNFPVGGLAIVMRLICFPYGRPYAYPKDKLNAQLAKQAMTLSPMRDRLTRAVFCHTNSANDPIKQLDETMETVIMADALKQKLKNAKQRGELPANRPYAEQINWAVSAGYLTVDSLKQLERVEALVHEALEVDEF